MLCWACACCVPLCQLVHVDLPSPASNHQLWCDGGLGVTRGRCCACCAAECLDGAQRFLKPDGISIPQAYTSFLHPITSHKLWNDVKVR